MQRQKTFPNILIAVSGGADSMFLATLIIRLFNAQKIPLKHLFLVHCNHKVRPESDQEEQFLRHYFKKQQLIVVKKPAHIKTTEAALRNRRYSEWKKIMEKNDINQIFLGHHFDDRVETTFLHLLRGCGREWFLGMQKQEPHHLLGGKMVVRPLITYHKKDILVWCKKLKIPYVTDQSNYDSKTSLRNKIRIEYIPLLYKQKWFEETIRNIYALYEKDQEHIQIQPISQSPYRHAKRAYRIQIKQEDITGQKVAQLLKQLHATTEMTSGTVKELEKFLKTSGSGRKFLQGMTFFVAHGKLYVIKALERFREKTVDKQQQIDKVIIKRFPQTGDRIHGKSRSKYCNNHQIPLFWRNFIPISVEHGNDIHSTVPNKRSDHYTPEF